jgi:hypothetical protein
MEIGGAMWHGHPHVAIQREGGHHQGKKSFLFLPLVNSLPPDPLGLRMKPSLVFLYVNKNALNTPLIAIYFSTIFQLWAGKFETYVMIHNWFD